MCLCCCFSCDFVHDCGDCTWPDMRDALKMSIFSASGNRVLHIYMMTEILQIKVSWTSFIVQIRFPDVIS